MAWALLIHSYLSYLFVCASCSIGVETIFSRPWLLPVWMFVSQWVFGNSPLAMENRHCDLCIHINKSSFKPLSMIPGIHSGLKYTYKVALCTNNHHETVVTPWESEVCTLASWGDSNKSIVGDARNERKVGCPIIYTGTIHYFILSIETSTMPGTTKPVLQLQRQVLG